MRNEVVEVLVRTPALFWCLNPRIFAEIYERSAWTNLPTVAMNQVPAKPQVNIYQAKRRQIQKTTLQSEYCENI